MPRYLAHTKHGLGTTRVTSIVLRCALSCVRPLPTCPYALHRPLCLHRVLPKLDVAVDDAARSAIAFRGASARPQVFAAAVCRLPARCCLRHNCHAGLSPLRRAHTHVTTHCFTSTHSRIRGRGSLPMAACSCRDAPVGPPVLVSHAPLSCLLTLPRRLPPLRNPYCLSSRRLTAFHRTYPPASPLRYPPVCPAVLIPLFSPLRASPSLIPICITPICPLPHAPPCFLLPPTMYLHLTGLRFRMNGIFSTQTK